MDLAIVGFASASEPVHWAGGAEVPLKDPKNISLGSADLVLVVLFIREVRDLLHRGRVRFFELGCNEEARETDELKFRDGNGTRTKESVDKVDGEEQGL